LKIISISLDDETLGELDETCRRLGFKSRSKMIRSTIDLLLNEYAIVDTLKGDNEVVFIIKYRESERNHVSKILHDFEDAIVTTMHQHRAHFCLDIINVNSDAKIIKELFGILKRNKCIKSMNFMLLSHKS
jgi:CopG family nickel-responsive transcriptional regulator